MATPQGEPVSDTTRLVQNDRVTRRAGSADDPQRCPNEGAFVNLVVDQRFGVDVFQVPHTQPRLQLRVAWHSPTHARFFVTRLRIVCRGVTHGQREIAGREVITGTYTEAGLAPGENGPCCCTLFARHRLVTIIAPGVALAGMQRNAVT